MSQQKLNQESAAAPVAASDRSKSSTPFETATADAHVDPSTSSGSSPPRPMKTVSRDPHPRHWFLRRDGRYSVLPENLETIDVLDTIVAEVKCGEETARKLLKAGAVRLADDLETPKLVGHYVAPGGLTIAYRCEGAIRVEDATEADEDEGLWTDASGMPLPIQEREAWRVKCLDGCFASMKSNGGNPRFTERCDEDGKPSVKYLSPRGSPGCLVFVPRSVNPSLYGSPQEVWIVEGEKKAILLAEVGIPAVSISGVGSFGYRPDQQRAAIEGGSSAPTLAPVLRELLEGWGTKTVVIGFDSPDIYGRASGGSDDVVREAGRLSAALTHAKYEAGWLVLPKAPSGSKWGADDWIVSNPGKHIDNFAVVRVAEFQDVLISGDGREVAVLALLLARARGLKALGIGSGTPAAQVKAIVKSLKLNNEASLLEMLDEMARERPEPWVRSWIENRKATYSYRHESLFIGGRVVPLDVLLDRLHLDSFEGPRFRDRTLSAALGQWTHAQDALAVAALRAKLAFDSSVPASTVARFVTACTGKADAVDVAVVQHFIWQVKRKLNDLPVDFHMMPVLYRERSPDSKGQGGGKTTAVAKLLGPVSEAVVNVSDLKEAIDPRGYRRYTRAFVAVVDEMARGEVANTDSLKGLITAPTLNWRVLGKNKDAVGVNRATFIGTANKSLTELIYDSTGLRRFYQLECLETLHWETINGLDYTALWRSVDERGPAPILPVKAEVDARQELWTPKDAVEEWLTGFERRADADKATWRGGRKLHEQFTEWQKGVGRPSWSETRFGKRLKQLLKESEWEDQKRGVFYALFPLGPTSYGS